MIRYCVDCKTIQGDTGNHKCPNCVDKYLSTICDKCWTRIPTATNKNKHRCRGDAKIHERPPIYWGTIAASEEIPKPELGETIVDEKKKEETLTIDITKKKPESKKRKEKVKPTTTRNLSTPKKTAQKNTTTTTTSLIADKSAKRRYTYNIRKDTGANLPYRAILEEIRRTEELTRRGYEVDPRQTLGDKKHYFALNLFTNSEPEDDTNRLFMNMTNTMTPDTVFTKTVMVDATNMTQGTGFIDHFVALAKNYACPVVNLVFDFKATQDGFRIDGKEMDVEAMTNWIYDVVQATSPNYIAIINAKLIEIIEKLAGSFKDVIFIGMNGELKDRYKIAWMWHLNTEMVRAKGKESVEDRVQCIMSGLSSRILVKKFVALYIGRWRSEGFTRELIKKSESKGRIRGRKKLAEKFSDLYPELEVKDEKEDEDDVDLAEDLEF